MLQRGKRGEIAALDSLRSPNRRESQVERAVLKRIVVFGDRSAQVSRGPITGERVVVCTLQRKGGGMSVRLRRSRKSPAEDLPMSARREEGKPR